MDGTLKFDNMMVDTELAKTYLNKHNYEFGPLGCDPICNSKDSFLDSQGNKIIRCETELNTDTEKVFHFGFESNLPYLSVNAKLRKQMYDLAKKIEENAELFCQLEYLIRQTPKEDVKCCDIELISQNLLHCSSSSVPKWIKHNTIIMVNNTPLAMLGFIAHLLSSTNFNRTTVRIISGPETAVVCYLFTQLCHQVGLDRVELLFFEEQHARLRPGISIITECGGMAAITERSDVDSAVDALLSSSARYRWSLRSILIQESIYESVKKIFAWKCKNKTTDAALNALDPNLKRLCTEMFLFNEKLFLFDYVGDRLEVEAGKQQVVTVEAYRTTKDLLSLIKTQNPYSISLWSSDISEANEIAFAADVRIVWVNDFGVFNGPPAASQAFFSDLELDNASYYFAYKFHEKKHEILKKWSELSVQMRIEKITKCLENFKIENKDEKSIEFVDKLEDSMLNLKSGNFAHVQNGKFCVGTVVPFDLTVHLKIDSVDSIMNIVNGQGVMLVHGDEGEKNKGKILELFMKEELPIFIDPRVSLDFGKIFEPCFIQKVGYNLSRTKVVWTNFGTIFAN